jgi:hypothetical protein
MRLTYAVAWLGWGAGLAGRAQESLLHGGCRVLLVCSECPAVVHLMIWLKHGRMHQEGCQVSSPSAER